MRKCPNCAEENHTEDLFCKNCGRCLLAPNPDQVQQATTTPTEVYPLPAGIDFYDRHRIRKSSAIWPTRKPQTERSIIMGWLLLLNLIVLILVSQIAMYLVK